MSTNTQKMEVAAVGPRELLSGLQAFGVHVFHTTTKDAALTTVSDLRANAEIERYGVVFITESLVSDMNAEEYEQLLGEKLPIVLTIPDLSSSPNAGLEKLRTLAKRAIGSDIFANKE